MLERGLSHTGLPLKRKFRPRCCAKTRAGAPCIMRVVPGKRRCRFHGGLSTGPKTKAGRVVSPHAMLKLTSSPANTPHHCSPSFGKVRLPAGEQQLKYGIYLDP